MIHIEHLSYRPKEVEGKESPWILQDISLSIQDGEFIAIVGRNGAGKTTLIRHLNGILTPTTGQVHVNGLDTRNPANFPAIRQAVGMVFQQPEDQIIASTVEEDVAFGLENMGIPPAEIRSRVDEVLQQVGLSDVRLRPPHFLSAGQMQRLALAGVLALHPRCIVFDEVTAMLDPRGRRMALDMLRDLHRQGITIIFITHAMDEAALADRVIVLHQGRIEQDGPPAEILSPKTPLEKYGLERPPSALLAERLSRFFPALDTTILSLADLSARLPAYDITAFRPPATPLLASAPLPAGKKAIEVTNLDHIYLAGTPLSHQALTGASLSVTSGEAHGLIGATGSGKSTLLQHLNGLLRPQTGQVRALEFDLNDPRLKTKTVVEKIGLVFQNPELQFFMQYVGDEVAYGPRQYRIDEPLRERVCWAMETAGLNFEAFKDRFLHTLSGGEKRKVALASALALKPALLLLDEPTAGLDPLARRELIEHLRDLRIKGLTLVASSHRMEDLVAMVQNLTVYQRGTALLSGPREKVFSALEELDNAGLEPPVAAQVAHLLRQKGWPIPTGIVSGTMLERLLSQMQGGAHEPV